MNTGEWKERVRGYTGAGVKKAIMMGLIAVMATVFGVSPLMARTNYAGGGKKDTPVTAVVDPEESEKITLQDRYVDTQPRVIKEDIKTPEKYKNPEKRIVVDKEFGVMERRRAESDATDVFKYQVIDNLKYRKFGVLYDNVAFTYVWTRADFIKDMETLPLLATSWETVRDIEAKAIYPWRVDVTAKIGYKDGSGETRFKTVTVQFRQYDDNNALTPHGGVWKVMAGDLILLLPRR